MKNKTHLRRLIVIFIFFALILVVLVWRMLDLMVLNRPFLKGQGDARSVRIQNISAYRGMITDRNGIPLAISTPVQSVWVNPQDFAPTPVQLKKLSRVINVPYNVLASRLNQSKNREFIFLQRQVSPAVVSSIEQLKIPGINFQQEFKRYYPEKESTAQLVGFTNIDDIGIEGLELAFQDWLKGTPGKRRIVKDRTGRVIEELGVLAEPKPGNNLTLSIDRRIQYLAYHELANTVEKFSAKSGSVVVVDTQTGEILAAANAPSFNPNARAAYTRDKYRNKAITDSFEPGSVIKAFSIASALSAGVVTPDTIIDTRPSWMVVHGHIIRDVHNYGVLNVTGVLQHSSNVGVTKMVLQSPPEHFVGFLRRLGFGQRTESDYPGETEGSIVAAKDANPFVLATLSFGYGLSSSALQLAKAYMIFANQGMLKPVTLLHSDNPPPVGEQVLDKNVANRLLLMLEAVVDEDGTGKSARVSGYRVAGKTGTARIAGKHGYEEKRYISSFIGIAPVSKPRLAVVVVIHDPTKNGYYGAMVAGPLFAKVMSGALRTLNILPDNTG